MYKPLPNALTIKDSGIHDLGLFAKEGLAQGTNLGTCHIKIGEHILRTPLGGFINHSNTPNCVKVELKSADQESAHYPHKHWNLVTTRDIKAGEELTVRYTFYKV
jgi:SET domain-containing protein